MIISQINDDDENGASQLFNWQTQAIIKARKSMAERTWKKDKIKLSQTAKNERSLRCDRSGQDAVRPEAHLIKQNIRKIYLPNAKNTKLKNREILQNIIKVWARGTKNATDKFRSSCSRLYKTQDVIHGLAKKGEK